MLGKGDNILHALSREDGSARSFGAFPLQEPAKPRGCSLWGWASPCTRGKCIAATPLLARDGPGFRAPPVFCVQPSPPPPRSALCAGTLEGQPRPGRACCAALDVPVVGPPEGSSLCVPGGGLPCHPHAGRCPSLCPGQGSLACSCIGAVWRAGLSCFKLGMPDRAQSSSWQATCPSSDAEGCCPSPCVMQRGSRSRPRVFL